MGSKKHKKHSKTSRDDDDMPMEPSPQPVAASSGSATPKSGIKLVLKVGGSAAPAGSASPASSGSSNAPNAPLVAYSSTVPAPTPLYPGGYPPTSGISLRLVTNPDNAECTVKKVENPIANGGGTGVGGTSGGTSGGGAQSDTLSEASSHLQQHRHKKSEKKKKKKKKHHHHHSHCHHHKDHHKHHHGGEKRKDRADGDGSGGLGGSSGIGGSGGGGHNVGGATGDDDDDADLEPPPPKRAVTETIDNQPPLPEVPLRSPVGVSTSGPREVSPLHRLLGVLLELVRKRDTYEFFAWPVNDAIAPGYSTIIQRPMDLSTMKRRLDNREYSTLEAFRADIRLICDNATTYNQPDTIYYKEARKLWRHAQKIVSKEHILQLDPELKYIGSVPVEQLGFDLRTRTPEPVEEMTPRLTRNRVQSNSTGRGAANDDEMVGRATDRSDERAVPTVKISLAASVVEQALATVGAPGSPAVVTRDDKEGVLAAVARSERVASVGGAASAGASPVIERTYTQDGKREDQKDVTGKEPQTRSTGHETAAVVNGDVTMAGASPLRPVSPPGLAKKSKPDDEQQQLHQQSQAIPSDDAPAAEILAHAQRMARGAANRLAMLKPNTDYAFLLQNDDGSTTLNILNPDVTLTDKYVGLRPAELPVPPQKVDLEMLVGKLPYGMSNLVDFKDEARSVAKPINYLTNDNGPPFSTFAPHYDSSFSNLTKIESDLVYQTYGDELGVQYADSIMHFAKDCDYLMNMVDNLLDTLTGGQHSKTLKLVRSGELLRDPEDEESMSSDKQPQKEKDNGKSAGTSGTSQADKDKPNQKVQTAEKVSPANEKPSMEKQQDKSTAASNGPTNQPTAVLANGTDAAKCNGNAMHGANAMSVSAVSSINKATLPNGHAPPVSSVPAGLPVNSSLHNGVPQTTPVVTSNVPSPQLVNTPQTQMINPASQMPSQHLQQAQQQTSPPHLQHQQHLHHPCMGLANHNQQTTLPSTNSGPSNVAAANHFVPGVPTAVGNHFAMNNLRRTPPASGSVASSGPSGHMSPAVGPGSGTPVAAANIAGPMGAPVGSGLVAKSMAGSLHQGGLPTQPLVHGSAAGMGLNVATGQHGGSPIGSSPAGSPVVVSRTPTPASTNVGGATTGGANGAPASSAATATSGEKEQKLQAKLAESTEMIERLTRLQRERLSQPPPPHLGMTQGPSPTELQLAEKLAATLSELASHAKPGSIVSVDAIRRAMGITLLPPGQSSKPQQPPQVATTQMNPTSQTGGFAQPTTSHPAHTSSNANEKKTQ